MSLKETLMADLKQAMKDKDKRKKDTITLVRSDIKRREVDERIELSDSDIEEIIAKQIKEKKNSLEDFKRANRDDLLSQTNEEIDILKKYLPKQLSEDELIAIVKQAIEQEEIKSQKDMGRLMKVVMPKVKGRADGNEVNRIARDLLK